MDAARSREGDGSDTQPVLETERWLRALIQDAPFGDGPSPRILCVLDEDFGELTTIMILLLGQSIITNTTLLLSERLFASNPEILPGRTRSWRGESDIVTAIERERPELVFLCAGYLMPIHQLLSPEALRRIVALARARGARVITADPFLGLLSQHDPRDIISIDVPTHAPAELLLAKQVVDDRLHTGLAAAERILSDAFHLYPAHVDPPDARNLGIFNPRLLVPTSLAERTDDGGPPHWMFVISRADYETQVMHLSPLRLAGIIADKLLETRALGRRPLLFAPSDLVDLVRARIADPADELDGIDIRGFCPFERFVALLLTAEHAFYWNTVSHSLLLRLMNGRPVLQFDRGHLLRAVPAMQPRVIAWYYQGIEPTYLDHEQPLSLATLDALAAEHERQAERMMASYQRGPTPAALVRGLLDGPLSPLQAAR